MLETAAIFISMAIGKKLLDHAGDDAADAFDTSLRRLARWVRQKVTTRQTGKTAVGIIEEAPDGEAGEADRKSGRKMLTAVLAEITEDPVAAGQLQDLVAEAERSAPREVVSTIAKGNVNVDEIIDSVVLGVLSTSAPDGSQSEGTITAEKVTRSWIVGNVNLH